MEITGKKIVALDTLLEQIDGYFVPLQKDLSEPAKKFDLTTKLNEIDKLKANWIAVLIGYTESYTPIAYARAVKITGLTCENLDSIILVDQSDLTEIPVRTAGDNVIFPINVPQGTYKVKYTYSANKNDAMVSFEIEKQ